MFIVVQKDKNSLSLSVSKYSVKPDDIKTERNRFLSFAII